MDYTEKTVTFLEKRILRFTWSISGKMEYSIVKSEISGRNMVDVKSIAI